MSRVVSFFRYTAVPMILSSQIIGIGVGFLLSEHYRNEAERKYQPPLTFTGCPQPSPSEVEIRALACPPAPSKGWSFVEPGPFQDMCFTFAGKVKDRRIPSPITWTSCLTFTHGEEQVSWSWASECSDCPLLER